MAHMDLSLIFKILNFALFVGLLAFFLRKPFREFWNSRTEGLKFAIESATRRRDQASSKFRELEGRYQKITEEMQRLRDQLKNDGELEKGKIIKESQEYAGRLERIAAHVAVQEQRKVERKLRELAAELAVTMAEKDIRAKIDASDQGRLVGDYLGRLGKETFASSKGAGAS